MKTKKKNLTRINKKWLALLQEALNEGVKIKLNHQFMYKGKKLGTFLVYAKHGGNKSLKQAVEDLGLNFTYYSKDFDSVIKTFIHDLQEKQDMSRHRFMNRFNRVILPKKKKMKKSYIKEINHLWKTRFNEERSWDFPKTTEERVEDWKAFRYNKELNPEGRWFLPLRRMERNQYFWIYTRKRKPEFMERLWHLFNKKELKELKKEGFYTPEK